MGPAGRTYSARTLQINYLLKHFIGTMLSVDYNADTFHKNTLVAELFVKYIKGSTGSLVKYLCISVILSFMRKLLAL